MTGAGLLLLLVPPALWGLVRTADHRRAARLRDLVGPRVALLAPGGSGRRRSWRRGLSALALGLAIVAWLPAETCTSTADTKWRGMDLVVCLDVSRSMLAGDVAPTRLARAKQEILGLAGEARGDRMGLVVFAGDAQLRVPLTQDVLSFAGLSARADPSDVERGGTDLGAALEAAAAALPEASERTAAILLLTDGEDLEQRGLAAAKGLAERGIVVHAVGFGSTRGSKIALEEDDASRFLSDRSGRDVVSALDDAGLEAIADATGGTYVPAGREGGVLATLYRDAVLPGARALVDVGDDGQGRFPFRPPLFAALGLWLIALALGGRRRAS